MNVVDHILTLEMRVRILEEQIRHLEEDRRALLLDYMRSAHEYRSFVRSNGRTCEMAMSADMLEELAHLFFLEATEWGLGHGPREKAYLSRCSIALVRRAKQKRLEEGRKDDAALTRRYR